MSDDTPTAPKRTRKRATAKVAPPELIGVMAPDPDPAAEPEAGRGRRHGRRRRR